MNPQRGQKLTAREAMQWATELAARAWSSAHPNPMVGCVVLDRQDCLLSWGYHEAYGEAHAEVNALKALNTEQLRGAKLFVTLEPCSHFGKTPPCADLLVSSPIAKVYYASLDVNPLVAGKGIAKLNAAGIATQEMPEFASRLDYLNAVFRKNHLSQQCFWAAKQALSSDAKISGPHGERAAISSPSSQRHMHWLRSGFAAIAVGGSTLRIDQPRLSLRLESQPEKLPPLVVFTRDPESLFAQSIPALQLRAPNQIICVSEGREFRREKKGESVCYFLDWQQPQQQIELKKSLYSEDGIYSLWLEPGRALMQWLLLNDLADRYYFYQSPHPQGSGATAFCESFSLHQVLERYSLKEEKMIEEDHFFVLQAP